MYRPLSLRRPLSIALLAALCCLPEWAAPEHGPLGEMGPQEAAADDAFENAERKYKEYLNRPSLFMRTRGRRRFAKTGHPDALKALIKSYKNPGGEEPKEVVRHTITMVIAEHFTKKRLVPKMEEWRKKYAKPGDAYVWYRTLLLQASMGMHAEVEEVASTAKSGYHRGAAIRALVETHHRDVLKKIPEWCKNLPRDPHERAVVLANMGWALIQFKEDKLAEDFQAAGNALIDQLDDKKNTHHAKLTIARHIAHVLNTSVYSLESGAWRNEFKVGGSGAGAEDARYVTFGGLKASGDRIAYVIDLSDSMLTPLSDAEKKDRGPITGGGERRGGLDWSVIENRFDLARELLRVSIEKLPETKFFSVAWFGDKSELFQATSGMIQATEKNKKKFFKELDSITTGPVRQGRPHGTLRGMTNLHGGIVRAFRVKKKGMLDKEEYVDKKAFVEGADSMFILSDGVPSTDDYLKLDKRDPEDRAGDPETGQAQQNTPQLNYHGPFLRWYLLDDVKRLNLYRNVEIHGLGIGEANMQLLEQLAALGLGKTRKIGVPNGE